MGVKLLERDRNGAIPTGAGMVLAERARGLLTEAQALAEAVRGTGAEPSGEMRIAIPQGVPVGILGVVFGALVELYPKMSWRVQTTDDPSASFTDDSLHAAVCLSAQAPDGPWIAKKLTVVPLRLLASRDYLAAHGTPETVDDLAAHRVLVYDVPGFDGAHLPLANGSSFVVAPLLRINDASLLRLAAVHGRGIVFAPDGPMPRALELGEEGLVRVLDDVVDCKIAIWFLAHATTWELSRVRLAFECISRLAATLEPLLRSGRSGRSKRNDGTDGRREPTRGVLRRPHEGLAIRSLRTRRRWHPRPTCRDAASHRARR